MFVQKIPFLHTISRKIQFKTSAVFTKKKKPSSNDLFTQLKRITNLYATRGFIIRSVITDLDFEPLRERLLPIELVTVAVDNHVSDVERSIQTSKE